MWSTCATCNHQGACDGALSHSPFQHGNIYLELLEVRNCGRSQGLHTLTLPVHTRPPHPTSPHLTPPHKLPSSKRYGEAQMQLEPQQ